MTIPTHPGSGAGIERLTRRRTPQRIPRPVAGRPGLFVVDATWGKIAPISLAAGVRTIGELEVLDHLCSGGGCIDCRQTGYYAQGTLPAAVNIPHQDIRARRHEVAPGRPIVMFCNGPQCTATPQAIAALLAAGHPAQALLYYRGGIHDWVTLGLPLHQP